MALFANFSKTRKFRGLKLIPFGIKLVGNSLVYSSYRYFKFPKILPRIARISITNKCDSRCKTCFIWNYYKLHPEKLREEMNFDEFKQFVDNNLFLEDITLTGGQITLRADIVDMWLYLDKKGYRTGGPTNAVNLSRIKKVQQQVLEKLSGKHIHSICLSIDGIGKEHDRIRGTKGDFKNAMKLLTWALGKQKEFPFLDVSVSHNITASNYKKFPNFIDYMINKGLDPLQISYRPTISSERFQSMGSKETLNNITENRNMIKELEKVKNRYKDYNYYFMNGMIKYLKNPQKQVIPCYAGFITVYIDPYWNAFACMDASTKIGNLRGTKLELKSLWKNEKVRQIQNNIKRGRCYNCWNHCYAAPSMISNPFKIASLAYNDLYRLFI
jgi:MoaA/NifB/PqqE/SkfB family radical SAM enzyme